MATDKNGNYIKGTKKELPEGWVTYGFRYAIFPSKEDRQVLERSFGCERKVYNEYVARLYEHLGEIGFQGGYIQYKTPNYTTITQKYEFLDKSNDSFVYNDAKIRFQAAVKKYNDGFAKKSMQYKKAVRKKMRTTGYVPTLRDMKGLPKFHSKKQGKFSYTTNQTNGNIKIVQRNDQSLLCIPKFRNGIPIAMHRELPKEAVIKKATIKREGNRYMVSLSVDFPMKQEPLRSNIKDDEVLALDYSQTDLYVDSQGRKAGYPRYHKIIEKRQRRLNKSLARKRNKALVDSEGRILYSTTYQNTLKNYQKTMAKAKNQRKDFLHKRSNQITNDYAAIVVEDLDLSNLAQCLSLGKKLHDNGFGMFRTMLEYKAKKKGKHLIFADKFFPSTKQCSECNSKKETVKLSERVYVCEHCRTKMDRDYNAARNLKQYGIRILSDLGFMAGVPVPV
ncbi:RNA-guided endonuclease InsQ/TnpB family protein [Bacillus sp. EB01]|uniref:RNA-guided endonuclease InsQ/TnpB family protein n=1 Tax=Bacillus sp. EB01 TaxID=1347086 RepID=UPI0006943420|nr:RNA-guided endonuclease TnpB family protein [Bacillus sp. EB01]